MASMMFRAVTLLVTAFAPAAPQSQIAEENVCNGNVWCESMGRFIFSYLVGPDHLIHGSEDDVSAVIVKLADSDGDKIVNFTEFLNFAEIYLRKAFSAIDLNKDNNISEEEAVSSVTRANFAVIESALLQMFVLADLDKDGRLSTRDIPMRKRDELDLNGDGFVSLKELLGHPIIFFPGPIQSVYRILDSNKDQIINREEANNFINFLGKIFNVLDINSDCFVPLDEALKAFGNAGLPKDFLLAMELMIRPYSALGRYLVLSAMEAADADSDGLLSLQEILNFESKSFVDSTHAVALPVYMSQSNQSTLYLQGKMDFEGRQPQDKEEENRWFNKALAVWLSTFQGVISEPAFQLPRPRCT